MNENVKKQGGRRPGSGRKPGSHTSATVKKLALKVIENAVMDENLPAQDRLHAALRLTENCNAK